VSALNEANPLQQHEFSSSVPMRQELIDLRPSSGNDIEQFGLAPLNGVVDTCPEVAHGAVRTCDENTEAA
jgi:hypothetical protein